MASFASGESEAARETERDTRRHIMRGSLICAVLLAGPWMGCGKSGKRAAEPAPGPRTARKAAASQASGQGKEASAREQAGPAARQAERAAVEPGARPAGTSSLQFGKPQVEPVSLDQLRGLGKVFSAGPKGPEVVFEKLAVQGSLTRRQVASAVARRGRDFLACAKAAGKASGRLVLQFVVSQEGHLKSPAVVRADAAVRKVASCLKAKAKAWQFPKPGGGIVVSRIWVAVHAEPQEAKRKLAVVNMDKTAIGKVFARRKAELAECLKAYAPASRGQVVLLFELEADGRVTRGKVEKAFRGGERLAGCLLGKVEKWTFPKPPVAPVVVRYPVTVGPRGR